jgi:multiple antibiotic resistance protein
MIALVMYFSYAYADWVTARMPPSITQGIMRVIAFILLCIGSEIVWNGLQNLLKK